MTYSNVFVDSDILLDVMLKRNPHVAFGRVLLDHIEHASGKFSTSSLIVANMHYLIAKNINKSAAVNSVEYVTNVLQILSFDKSHILKTISDNHTDFEDSIQYYIAKENNCDLIISRNIKHYRKFDLPVLTAEQYLRTIL